MLTSFLVWPLLLAWLLPPWTYWNDTPTMLGYLAIIATSSLTTTVLAMFCSVLFRRTPVAMMTAYLVLIVLYAVPLAVEFFAQLFLPAPQAVLMHHEPTGKITEAAVVRIAGNRGQFDLSVRQGHQLQALARKINERARRTGVGAVVHDNALYFQNAVASPGEFVRLTVREGRFDTQWPPSVWINRLTFTSPFAAAMGLPLKVGTPTDTPITANWPVFFNYLAFYAMLNASLLWCMLWLFNVRWRVRA